MHMVEEAEVRFNETHKDVEVSDDSEEVARQTRKTINL